MKLSKLFSRSQQLRLSDDVFGEIICEHGLWVALPFDRESGPMLIIDAGPNGPSELQRRFFCDLQQRLPSLCATSADYIREQQPGYDSCSFDLYSVEILNEIELNRDSFVLEFTSDSAASIIHRVEFESGRPASYGEDD